MIKNLKPNKGITLIELLIAIFISTFILLATGGIWLTGWNMFRQSQFTAQSYRNAMIPMAHIVKNLQQATPWNGNLSNYWNGRAPGDYTDIEFRIDDGNTPSDFANDDALRYIVIGTDLWCNRTNFPGPAPTNSVIGIRILNANFIYGGTNPVVGIRMNSTDNNGGNPYTLNTSVESRYMPGS